MWDDRLCGVDRDPASTSKGELVVPIVYLWEEARFTRRGMIAVAKHETPVEVLDQAKVDGRNYFLVRPKRAKWLGRRRSLRAFFIRRKPQGWVLEDFLLHYGKALA